ncbi:hypothetical protein AADX85_13085, partial [Staphylococcus epidermidis]
PPTTVAITLLVISMSPYCVLILTAIKIASLCHTYCYFSIAEKSCKATGDEFFSKYGLFLDFNEFKRLILDCQVNFLERALAFPKLLW